VAGLLFPVSFIQAATRPPLLIAYFVPNDREPIPGFVERLDGVMTEVQRFYREGMKANGYGPVTFDLGRAPDGKLEVYVVRAHEPMRAYGRNDASKVRDEVALSLLEKGVRIEGRTVVIFGVLLEWKGERAIEVGPYVGGGDHLSGTAWVYDDALLDPRELGSKKSGGYYGDPCSIGAFNSHYVGGVAHELGHALGLPHVAGPASNPKHSLMGDGNHTYGEELRGEGAGSYLHRASAMMLARCRPFAGELPGASDPPVCDLKKIEASFTDGKLSVSGIVAAHPEVFGIAAFNDFEGIPADYDAVGWTSAVEGSGRFRLTMQDLRSGRYDLRIVACHTNGPTSHFAFSYEVDAAGVPDLRPFSPALLSFRRVVLAYGRGDRDQARSLCAELDQPALDPVIARQVRQMRKLLNSASPRALAAVPPDQTKVAISELEFTVQRVGWGMPMRDQVLSEGGSTCFLELEGQVRERGLFAHAPSSYSFDPAGKWKRLTGGFGLQDGHPGSVVFVVRGDGRELYRSPRITDHRYHRMDLDIATVGRLDLVVEDAADGPSFDWGIWVEPTLER
jgi:hypothetical protein